METFFVVVFFKRRIISDYQCGHLCHSKYGIYVITYVRAFVYVQRVLRISTCIHNSISACHIAIMLFIKGNSLDQSV